MLLGVFGDRENNVRRTTKNAQTLLLYGGEFFMVMISQIFRFWCTTRAFIWISGLLRFVTSSASNDRERDEHKTHPHN